MSYLNTYSPANADVSNTHANTPTEEYDLNFQFPAKVLQSDRVVVKPFIPSEHAAPLSQGLQANPDVMRWVSLTTGDLQEVLTWVETNRQNNTFLYHAIFTAPPGKEVPQEEYVFAGVIGIINASVVDSTGELGWIMIMPQFQRTHVLTHAAGLILHRLLDSPQEGGLGLRRAQWFTNSLHVKSQAAAQRLGFEYEGLIRAHRILGKGKEGARAGRADVARSELASRDSWLASIIWEDWENDKREHVDKLMARR